MIKTLLATTGAVLLTVAALPAAPGGHSFAAARGGSPSVNRPAARVSPQFSTARRGFGYRGYRGGGYYGGYRHRYYLYGVPYFYDPFFFGGFGYYGGGYYGGYPYGYGYGYNNPYVTGTAGYYNGRVADDGDHDNDGDHDQQNAAALPKAVQKQLAQRGYYKGSVDGEFGPASKSALNRFQRDNNLRVTGRIDPATMKALGFEERD